MDFKTCFIVGTGARPFSTDVEAGGWDESNRTKRDVADLVLTRVSTK